MNIDAAIANTAWLASSLPEWARYRRAASHLEKTQRQLLRDYLRRNAATEFGRAHGFDGIRSWEEYAEKVPTRSYDDYRHWIERVAAGETNVITTDRVVLLEPSSGSTGAVKWVPYTRTLQAEYRRAVATWITGIFLGEPSLMGGRAYWSLTPQIQAESAGEATLPIGFDSDSAYLGGMAQRLVDRALATSPTLKAITRMDRFWRMTSLQLLLCRDLRLISVWHPSYILLLLKHLRHHWIELLADLKNGVTLVHPAIRICPAPNRGRELAKIGPDRPTALWPSLRLISCWGDADAERCLPEVRAEFPGVRLQPKGLVATEAFVSFPLGDLRPLAARSHYFEFRNDGGEILPAWALEAGDVYSLIVTTGGGLYRYELRDSVEVTGYYRDLPSLRFLAKEDNVADHCGEKLNEKFVAACMAAVFDQHGISPGFSMLALDEAGATPGYTLYIEVESDLPDKLDSDLEDKLRRNPHYDLCVNLGQLRPLQLAPVPAEAYEVYSRAMMKRGMRLGDIKPTPLSRFTDWSQKFSRSNHA